MYGYVCKHCGSRRASILRKVRAEEEKRWLPGQYSRAGKNGWKEEKDTSAVRIELPVRRHESL